MIIIPARLNSTRFPQKIMVDIGGMPMFIKSAKNASVVDEVVLALDSNETLEIAKRHGIRAVKTDINIANGSLRVLQAARILGLKDDEVIINLQADEPFLEHDVIKTLLQSMKDCDFMATCARVIDESSASNPNIVKVLLDANNNAIYFSRFGIPFNRDSDCKIDYLGHLGIYGYFKSSLEEISSMKDCKLENIEKLEQLRAIYYGRKIRVNIVQSSSIGIDTREDLQRAKEMYGF